jgi:hypothetical protein
LNLGSHSHHKQSPDIAVSFLADPAQALFAAARSIQAGEPQLGSELTPVLELFPIADGGDNG